MKKFGFATIAAAGFAAALVGLAAPAVAAEAPANGIASLTVPAGVDHLDWLNDIKPNVNVPKVDTTVQQSR